MNSLHSRIAVWLIASVFVLFGVHWLTASFAPQRFTEDYVISRLKHDGEGLLVGLVVAADGKLDMDPHYIAPIYDRPYSGHYFVIQSGDQRLRSRSLWDNDMAVPDLGTQREAVWHISGASGKPLLVWSARFRKNGRSVVLSVAEDLSELDSRIASFHWRFSLITLLALGLLIGVQHLLLRMSLRPLERLGADCRRLETGEIARLPENVPTETRPLVAEINRLVELQERRLNRSRQALGNLAHALKTPLTLLRNIGERSDAQIDETTRRDLDRAVDEMRAVIDRELRRARLAGAPAGGERFALDSELDGLCELLHKVHARKSVETELSIPANLSIPADREDMLELFGNVLDNAFKWATSRVRVRARLKDREADIVIEDDGPGADLAALEGLTTRGTRLDETRPGHGLGLAIVHDIVTQYGGTLELGRSDGLGGFQVTLRLPI